MRRRDLLISSLLAGSAHRLPAAASSMPLIVGDAYRRAFCRDRCDRLRTAAAAGGRRGLRPRGRPFRSRRPMRSFHHRRQPGALDGHPAGHAGVDGIAARSDNAVRTNEDGLGPVPQRAKSESANGRSWLIANIKALPRITACNLEKRCLLPTLNGHSRLKAVTPGPLLMAETAIGILPQCANFFIGLLPP